MTLSEELQWRGFVNQTTLPQLTDIDQAPLTFYWGVDPSADSMTIGNLAAGMLARHFIDYGHKAYLLVGGATGLIGDPDGKKEQRDLKPLAEVEKNKNAIAAQYKTIFAGKDFETIDNYDWFKNINYMDFLREIGRNVPLSNMLGREFVQSRLGEGGAGISYAEFSYALIQGFDFLHLYREHGVTLQLCGADQWGNSIAGVDLVRRIAGGEAHVYSTPLVINKATGVKFGKSEGGAIWLDPIRTTPYKFYQFWLNTDDEGVIDYIKIYTLFSREQVEALEVQTREHPEQRAAQYALASAVTELVHGEQKRASVQKVTDVLFAGKDISLLDDTDLDVLAQEIPTLGIGTTIVEALVSTGIAASNGEARRLLTGNAISLNGEKVTEDSTIEVTTLLKKGKNSFLLIR